MMLATRALDGDWGFQLATTGLAGRAASGEQRLIPAGQGFNLILLQSGSAILTGPSGRLACRGPALLCLNESDWLELESAQDLAGTIISFDPLIINDRFADLDILRHPPEGSGTLNQDRFYLLPFIDRGDLFSACLELPPAALPVFEDKLRRMQDQLAVQPGYWPCRARSYLLEMLFSANQIFLEHRESPTASVRSLPAQALAMDRVLLHLDTHFCDDINLEDLARQFGTNRTSLNQRLHALCGMSAKAYVISLRLRFASLLLRDTALPAAEVMERAGFSDQTHFCRMFRKNFQMSPGEYRSTHSWHVRAS